MRKLIVNADDFGYRSGINKGIIHSHKNGVVTSASLFVNKEGTEEAVELAKQNPSLGIGIHIDLDRFFQVEHGSGIITGFADPSPNFEDIEREIRHQIEKFYSFGLKPDHINSHHHAHLWPNIFPLVCKVASEFSIRAIRLFTKYMSVQEVSRMYALARDLKFTIIDHFIEGWYWGNVDEEYHVAEIMTHPGFGELWRESEVAYCCQPQLREYLKQRNIELVRFSDIIK